MSVRFFIQNYKVCQQNNQSSNGYEANSIVQHLQIFPLLWSQYSVCSSVVQCYDWDHNSEKNNEKCWTIGFMFVL